MSEQNETKKLIGGVAIVAVILVVWGVYLTSQKDAAPAARVEDVVPTESTETQAVSGVYKDGTYTVVGAYSSPAGAEEVGITLVLKDGLIADASAEIKATNPISKKLQEAFADGFKLLIVGKSLNEVKLDKVSGSSLTPKGFNDAVEKIKLEAKA